MEKNEKETLKEMKMLIVKLAYGTITEPEAEKLEEWAEKPGNTRTLLRLSKEISEEKNKARNKFLKQKK